MKKFIITIATLFTLSSCYKDLGNYDYKFDQMDEIENVTLTPQPEEDMNGDWVIEFTQPAAGSGIRTEWIKADITHKFQNEDTYRCEWKYNWPYETSNGSLAFKDTTIIADSIPVKFAENTNTSYEIMLIVKDCSNSPASGVEQYYSITVNSVPPFKNSLMVLHGKAGERLIGNIDDNKLPAQVTYDVWKQIYGDKPNPFKTVVNIFDNSTYHNNGTQEHYLFVATYTGSGYIYNSYGLTPIYNEYWTYPNIEGHTIIPKQIGKYNPNVQCGFMIDQQGMAYICGRAFKMQFFQIGANVEAGTDGHITSDQYEAECGIMYADYLLLWDKKEGRFLTTFYMGNQFPSITTLERSEAKMTAPLVDAGIDFTTSGYESPKGMNAVFGYISCDGSEISKAGYMIFVDNANNAYAYRLEIVDKEGTPEESSNAPQSRASQPVERFRVTERVALSGLENFTAQSPMVYYSQLDPSFFYYASGGNLYRYNMTNKQSYLVYTAPEGYIINLLKFRCETNYSYAGTLTSILDIAMSKDGEGAIATIKLNNSGSIDNNFEPQFYTGFGPIADIAFAHDYIYQKLTFE